MSAEGEIVRQIIDREAEVARLFDAADDGRSVDGQDADEALLEYALEVSTSVQMEVLLSTGGPSDYLTATVAVADRAISDVRYHYAPWFDHADLPVAEGSALWRLAERFAEFVALPGGHQ